MDSDLEKARSKINELEGHIFDHDQAMQFEKNHFEERLSSQSWEITKLKNNEDSLVIKVTQAEYLVENTYKMGWENAIAQM